MFQTEMIPLALIEPNKGQVPGLPKNPKLIKDERFEALVQSIKDDPEMLELRELIVFPFEGKYVTVAGNMRYHAQKHLKKKDSPCKVLPPETPPEKLRAYAIKDNIEFGEPDWDLLANEWDRDELVDWGLELELSPEELGTEFNLPDGEKPPFQIMSFTLADAQAERIKRAIKEVQVDEDETYGNENGNGNALHQIVKEWEEQRR